MNFNWYATKKTVAHGLFDVALFSANVTQLRQVLELGQERYKLFWPLVILLCISLSLQVIIAILCFIIGYLNVNKTDHQTRANVINNIITISTFVVTVLNVVVSSIGTNQFDWTPMNSTKAP